MADRYEVKAPGSDWIEVSKEEWIYAERKAGFRPNLASTNERYMKVCATAGFTGGGIQGRIVLDAEPGK